MRIRKLPGDCSCTEILLEGHCSCVNRSRNAVLGGGRPSEIKMSAMVLIPFPSACSSRTRAMVAILAGFSMTTRRPSASRRSLQPLPTRCVPWRVRCVKPCVSATGQLRAATRGAKSRRVPMWVVRWPWMGSSACGLKGIACAARCS